ncbi:MAG: hypothetical protein AABW59_00840 [archaeon]
MKGNFFVVLLLLLGLSSLVGAVAVIVPVYVASLSIIALVSNVLITAAVYVAAKGVFSRKSFGGNFSEKLNVSFEIFGKIVILLIVTMAAIFIFSPVTIEDSLVAGLFAALIALLILLLVSYRKIAVLPSERKAIAKGIMGFCVFVFISCSIISYFSVEFTVATGAAKQQAIISFPFEDIVKDVMQSSSAPVYSNVAESPSPSQGISSKATEESRFFSVILLPTSAEVCIISNLSAIIRVEPVFGCYIAENGIRQKTFCPIVISAEELNYSSDINSSGSCSGPYTVEG